VLRSVRRRAWFFAQRCLVLFPKPQDLRISACINDELTAAILMVSRERDHLQKLRTATGRQVAVALLHRKAVLA
jgi:hypothetical protein